MKETFYYQELFDLMSNEHDLHLTKGQMDDIISVVNKMQIITPAMQNLSKQVTIMNKALGG
jgi:hypothetical protein